MHLKKCGADSTDSLTSSDVSQCYTGLTSYMGRFVLVNVKIALRHTYSLSQDCLLLALPLGEVLLKCSL